ncbi:polysaccharide pyruvyl transferase family protein [Microbacteriaceae bacterium VKM Ac-2854]|nr:polysaccharide pyruvyl transferase family protein [Microbacteriaceae bacterium VKM Ac-2854]
MILDKKKLRAVARKARLRIDSWRGPELYNLLALALNRTSAANSNGEFDTIIVAPSGGGSIGDQALVEGALRKLSGKVLVISRAADSYRTKDFSGDVVVEGMPRLITGGAIGNVRGAAELLGRLKRNGRLVVIGADVMDGLYNPSDSVARFEIARQASKRGFRAALLPFSWNETPRPSARRAALLASKAGVDIYARDPESFKRLRALGVAVTESADLVFNDDRLSSAERINEIMSVITDRRDETVIVNVSGLVSSKPGLLEAYVDVVNAVLEKGYSVLILPHDLRKGVNDLDYCRQLANHFTTDGRVGLVPDEISPSDIRGVSTAASFIVTGRMHLAVMSLMNGRPNVALSVQGKVFGLLSNFGISEYCVEIEDAVRGALLERTLAMVDDVPHASERVRDGLPAVVELAARPFAG